MTLPEPEAQPHITLRVHLPATYPSQHPPVFELSCDMLAGGQLGEMAAELEGMFSPGEVVLWQWVEHLRERWADLAPKPAAEDAAAAGADIDADAALAAELQAAELLECGDEAGAGERRQRQARSLAAGDEELERAIAEVAQTVVHGEPFTERRSTFQAHVAPATSMKHVKALMELLLQNGKIRAATHNIMAYRIEQPDKQTFMQDYDDDGEAAAGGRLLHLLQMTDARNVCVVVSRWYGGILLGPSRFAIINNTARQLLEALGYIAGKDGSSGSSSSKGGGGGSKGKKR
ncbi:IMPACT [Chlorella sorokiniana]|uniref:IMPACT n=1 Tax=Chlorella sorokiniana TaxID=3076 RepID=A0A2P6TQK1_CHLSO|nr:IMPACT [Chlorella sorokiniana]|eukprot:PRW56314.1 IMPACT [Chlorella sorokiniana]